MTIYFTYNSRFGVPGSNDPPRILSRDAVDVKCFFKFSGLMRGENIKTARRRADGVRDRHTRTALKRIRRVAWMLTRSASTACTENLHAGRE